MSQLWPIGSLKARLASLNQASSSSQSSSSRNFSGGSLKDKIARYDGGAPLVPKSAFGTGLGVDGGRGREGGALVGNRIPSAGRGGFGVTPGSTTSQTSSSARSISSTHAQPPSTSIRDSISASSATGRQSPALRSSIDSSSNASGPPAPTTSSETSGSPITSPAPSSPAPHTTNALPASFLQASDPDAAPRDDENASIAPSLLVQPPGSTTSLSSLTSDVSVASSYMIEPQQPPYTEVQATELEEDVATEDEDGGLFVGGGLGGGLRRPSSPARSSMAEAGSKAPSTVGDEDEGPRGLNDAPLTPRAEHFRELSLEDADMTARDLDEEVLTPPAGNQEQSQFFVGLSPDDPEAEPEIEAAEHVPVLENKEKEEFEEKLNAAPEVEIGGEAAVEAKVESWAEGVATAAEPKAEEKGEVEPIPVEAETPTSEAENSLEPHATPTPDESTPPAPSATLPAIIPVAESSPTEPDSSPNLAKSVVEVEAPPLDGEIKTAPPVTSPPSPIHGAIPTAVAAAFEQKKKDQGLSVDDTEVHALYPTSDFEPVEDATTSDELGSSIAAEPSALPPLSSGPITDEPVIQEDGVKQEKEEDTNEDELKSPIPGSFPGSPTHSQFALSTSRSSSLARASLQRDATTLNDDTKSSSSSSQELDLPALDTPVASPAFDLASFPSVPSAIDAAESTSAARPSTPPRASSIPFPSDPHKTPEQSELRRATSTKTTKSPHELDSDDEDVVQAGEGKVTLISRERYS